MPRSPLIAANWKMNAPPDGWNREDSPYRSQKNVEVVVFPTYLHLANCIDAKLITGGQCGHPEPKGPHTGEVSMTMLKEIGCTYVLCGHSERRREHKETDAQILLQVKAALASGLTPILCIGESAEEHAAGKAKDRVREQLKDIPAGTVISYEPVWAIGTKVTPKPQEVQDMHVFIRTLFPKTDLRILYGGSACKDNAKDFLAQPDIDGLLVGGASLHKDEFHIIVDAAKEKA